MKKLLVVGSGTVGALAVATALFGTGVASADPYEGQTFDDAASAASQRGQSAVIANRVGSYLPEGQCIVTRSQEAPFTSADDGSHVSRTMQFYLNCNGDVATEISPGASAASEGGRYAKAVDDAQEARAAAQQAARAAQAEQELQQEAMSGGRG